MSGLPCLRSVTVADVEACFNLRMWPDCVLASAFTNVGAPAGARVHNWAAATAVRWWSPTVEREVTGGQTVPPGLPVAALTTLFTVSALLDGLTTDGLTDRRRRDRQQALELRLDRAIGEIGMARAVRVHVFCRAAAHEAALRHIARVAREVFISGAEHLPGFPAICQTDAFLAEAAHLWAPESDGSVMLTPEGAHVAALIADVAARGRLAYRRALLAREIEWRLGGSLPAVPTQRVMVDQGAARAAFAAFARVSRGARLLDVGSGAGAGLITDGGLAEATGAGGTVIALDPDRGALHRLELTARERQLRHVRTLAGCGEELPLASESQDIVTSTFTLECVDGAACIREMARVVRPGGAVVVMFFTPPAAAPLIPAAVRTAEDILGGSDGASRSLLSLADPDEVRAHALSAGLAEIRTDKGTMNLSFRSPSDAAPFLRSLCPLVDERLWELPYAKRVWQARLLDDQLAGMVSAVHTNQRTVQMPYTLLRAVRTRPVVEVGDPVPDLYHLCPQVAVDPDTGRLYREGQVVKADPAVGLLAYYLARHPPRSLRRLCDDLHYTSNTLRHAKSDLDRLVRPWMRIDRDVNRYYVLVAE